MDWFARRTEDSVRMGSRSHGIIVLDVMSELNMALKFMVEGKQEVSTKCLERLFLSEHEADRLEDKLCAEIAAGDLSIQEREDLIHFVRKMDQIANWGKEAALYIQLIQETHSVVPEDVWIANMNMSAEIMTAVKYLIKAVETLNDDPKDTVRHIDSVNDQERIVDTMFFENIKQVHLSDMDPKAVMLVRDLIHSLEMSADMCKTCADTITILLKSRRL